MLFTLPWHRYVTTSTVEIAIYEIRSVVLLIVQITISREIVRDLRA